MRQLRLVLKRLLVTIWILGAAFFLVSAVLFKDDERVNILLGLLFVIVGIGFVMVRPPEDRNSHESYRKLLDRFEQPK